jgi:hypothetical protein
MKSMLLLIHLILGFSYPAAAAAEVAGVLPASVLSFPAFVSFYVAAGILAIAVRDYARPTDRERRVARPAVPAATALPRERTGRTPGWHASTVSA